MSDREPKTPDAYTDAAKALAEQLCAEAGLPPELLDGPRSADVFREWAKQWTYKDPGAVDV